MEKATDSTAHRQAWRNHKLTHTPQQLGLVAPAGAAQIIGGELSGPNIAPSAGRVAELSAFPRPCAARSRAGPAGREPGGFYLVHDGHRLGLERRGDGGKADGGKAKAQVNGPGYAVLTTTNAAAAVERRAQMRAAAPG